MIAHLVAEFFVPGIPQPQGSKTAFVNRHTGRAAITDQNKVRLAPWRSTVTAIAAKQATGDRLEGPVLLELSFQFVRPKSVSASKRPFPTVKPDLSKILRAVEDAITDSGLWRDDALVVKAQLEKVYAERPGVQVRISEYRQEQQG